MAEYVAPTREIRFVLDHVIDMAELLKLEPFQEVSDDLVQAVLEEGGKFSSEKISPLYAVGDRQGSVLADDGVKTPDGFKDAYQAYVENGWNGICGPVEYGGQGMPQVLGTAVQEMMASANQAFTLCPILGQGAVEALEAHGTEEQQKTYMEKLVSGEWTGTMNLTEPQAGSDVGALRTRADPQADGTYRISGQKIFISWGEHDMAENIIHLVLARTPGSPEGTKGISLFIVPKYLINEDGSLGEKNDLRAVSLEHKMGIHASPTCVMSYGDNGNCVGYLIGGENQGMRCMFTMMNNARLNVGILGLCAAERGWQMALDYARDRRQGKAIGSTSEGKSPIIEHADVRRMLMTIKSTTEAVRAIIYLNALALDMGRHHPDGEVRRKYRGLADLLTPISKAYGTDLGVENSSLAVQVFGGMGYIEETGIAQVFRDARIHPIYEGTNGIQAMDLVGRKLAMDGGEHWQAFLGMTEDFIAAMPEIGELAQYRENLSRITADCRESAEWLLAQQKQNMRDVAAGSVPFLRLMSMVVGGYLMAKAAVAAQTRLESGTGNGDEDFLRAKIATVRFYGEQVMPTAFGLKEMVMGGDSLFYAIEDDHMAL
ncbi:acyl-CoA dehydrogenase C-terminal domain-containing protein [Emcibacter nanhaiensis]|uniref:3-methylmercaptopropionyl-CoA dehydrogenase n=1 Tax=Emcibacter nanhaiensis TaxID=1505037 RepID=A0A501PBX9_9PROT|nr:acyl-CoA dehydrogenase C-terminal domain-containing protein [Emcibacter nanhaiensis]TPD57512.1 acyl-CoA dehydrogenase [Emcibacter nanhaiensis]